MDYSNNMKNYIIFDTSEIDKIDFNQVLETSKDTLRLSIDGSKTFVKWIGDTPSCIDSLTTKGSVLSIEQIVEEMFKPEWVLITSGSTEI